MDATCIYDTLLSYWNKEKTTKLRIASFTTFQLFMRYNQTHSAFLKLESRSKCLGVAQGVNVFRNILQDASCLLLELEATVNAEISRQSIMGRFLGCCVVLLSFQGFFFVKGRHTRGD